jgi:hypothetical protein
MSNFQTLPSEWQYVILALAAAVGTFFVLFGANRIQARRKNAGELADKLTEWGLSKLATPLKAYSYGDYSEAIHGFVELAKDLHAPGVAVSTNAAALFETAVTKIVTHYAAANATKAKDVLDILKNGAASKALFTASSNTAAATQTTTAAASSAATTC